MPALGLILAGGLALGAYQAGAYATLAADGRFTVSAVAGSSIGAINGAIILGNPAAVAAERLAAFWAQVAADPLDPFGLGFAPPRATSWASIAATRLTGVPGIARPRPWALATGGSSLYGNEPLIRSLAQFVDFDRLNASRFIAVTTDLHSADAVAIDSARVAVAPEHLAAAGGLLPNFPAMALDGRWLGDGGLSANLPYEPFVASDRAGAPARLLAIELFAPRPGDPVTLGDAAERSNDVKYASQSRLRLAGLVRERALEAALHPERSGQRLAQISYAGAHEKGGMEKMFDCSHAALRQRWDAGARDAAAVLDWLAEPPPERGLLVRG